MQWSLIDKAEMLETIILDGNLKINVTAPYDRQAKSLLEMKLLHLSL